MYIPKQDKNIQTDIVVGDDDIKKTTLELLTKRHYSKSEMSNNKKQLESDRSLQPDIYIEKWSRQGRAINRELKEAKEEIEDMNDMILRSWKMQEEQKRKKQNAIRRFRIERSASQELATRYNKIEHELAEYKCEQNGWVER